MTGTYAIAEVVDDSNKRPSKTIFVIMREDSPHRFRDSSWKSLVSVAKLVNRNGGVAFEDLKWAIKYINKKLKNARVL